MQFLYVYNDKVWRKLENLRLKAQAEKAAGNYFRAEYFAQRYGQLYRQIAAR